jgi:hypothetical protein
MIIRHRSSLRLRRLLLVVAFLPGLGASAEFASPQPDKNQKPVFPLRISANHRHLEGADGRPFLVVGDTAWSLIAQLHEPDLAYYLDDRHQRGFNAIIVSLIEHLFASRAPAKIDGVEPFIPRGDFTRPNPEYFDFAYRAIAAAGERGIAVWLCPAYLGWEGKEQGFYQEIVAAGPAALRAYGRYVGARFKDLPNVVWMVGGDFALPESERWTAGELIAGIRESGATQIATAHGGQTDAVTTFGDEPWLAIDNVYSYAKDLHRPLRIGFARTPPRPFVLIESTYEGEYDAPPELIRRQAWWAMLTGACGQFFGNNPIWHFDGPGLFESKQQLSWKEALASEGSQDMARLGNFFSGQPWERLNPDWEERLVTSGQGEGITLVTAAIASDSRLAIVYVPSDGEQPRSLSLDLSSFPSSVKVQWFNPTSGVRLPSSPAALPNREEQRLSTPGDNGTGPTTGCSF